ncbi:MAG: hypothetical protein FWG10_12295 [Eubacteriaceae bacterium]|nr:hypothetical protein [Eubacteriaceae bacterium]
MGLPEFPVFDTTIDSNEYMQGAIGQIFSSIAMEELALSHILNAEGEKLQFVLGTLTAPDPDDPTGPPIPIPGPGNVTVEDIIDINNSVKDMISTVSMSQMFLLGKMSSAMDALRMATEDTTP